MKKLFAIALIATALVSCNDGEKKVDETTTSDTTTVITTPETTTPDTMMVVTDSTVKTTVEVDTMKK